MVYNILLLLIILVIFILLNRILNIQENFDIYFLPFYNVESNLLRNFYVNDDYNKSYFKHKINYSYVYILANDSSYEFFNEFNKILLQKSRIENTKLIKLDNYENNLNYIKKYNNSITNITMPIFLKKNIDNINLVSKLNKTYLICLTKLKYQTFNITDIDIDSKIGILNNKNTIYYYYDKIFKDMNKNIKKENIIIYNSLNKLYSDLLEDKIKFILYFSELPNEEFNNFLDKDFMNEIIILPFELNDQLNNLFFKKNDFAKITYFDLNKINQKYLPKKFGDQYYFIYKPNIKLLTLNQLLICNDKINSKLINDIFTFLLNYKNKFKNTQFQIDYIEPTFELIKYIPYQNDILNIFRKYGYITNVDSSNCKYFVGKKECTKNLLKNNGLN